jgi:uncharacterized lipoprotein YehR (DUF1307 family)
MNLQALKMKKTLAVLLALMLMFSLVACGGGGSSLVGKWVPEEGQDISGDFIEERMELSKDGTGIGDGMSLKWKAEKDRLTFNLDLLGFGLALAYDYEISGDTLTLTNDDGESVTYKKE